MEIAIMVEGQDNLDWPRWKRIVRATEDGGLAGLYRSDHFTNPDGPYKSALELWTSFTWLADNTERVEFGPLVSPVSFRHPVVTAWQAGAVDDLSGGRLRLGLGAGWQTREHDAFGFDLLDTDARFARFEEGLEIITRLLHSDGSVSFEGEFYRLDGAMVSPKPGKTGIIVGGNGPRRTLPLVVKHADEWNAVMQTPEKFAGLSGKLDEMLAQAGRRPEEVRRTMMARAVFGRTDAEVRDALAGRDRGEVEGEGTLVGTAGELVEGLRRLEEAGVERVMLQMLDGEDAAEIEFLADEVLPELQ